MVEAMVSLLLMSVVIAAAIPVMTKMSQNKTEQDQDVLACIKNSSLAFYDDVTGATTMPSETDICYKPITNVKFETGNALSSLKWKADKGSSQEKTAAKKLLRTACDDGGQRACEYFVNKCITEGQTADPFCDETDFLDIAYYLEKSNSSVDKGVLEVRNLTENNLPSLSDALLGQVNASCTAVADSLACDLYKPWIYIKACNYGSTVGCTVGFDNNYNKSCHQIRTIWLEAPTGTYNLTFKGAATPTQGTCNMTSFPTAAITGCNIISSDPDNCTTATPDVADTCSNDCIIAYNNNYNRDCEDILVNWLGAPFQTYNITKSGAPPAALSQDTCQGAALNCTVKPGLMCRDGTIFIGEFSNQKYFTTPKDQGLMTFDQGTGRVNDIYEGYLTPDSPTDGEYNTYILNYYSDLGYGEHNIGFLYEPEYYAAGSCDGLNENIYLGHTDWFLPSINEFEQTLRKYYSVITDLKNATYWTSTKRAGYVMAKNINPVTGKIDSYTNISLSANSKWVRCVRSDGDFTPPAFPQETEDSGIDCANTTPDIGTICSDGTVYAGSIAGRKIFTTNDSGVPGKFPFNSGAELGRYYPIFHNQWYYEFNHNHKRGELNTCQWVNMANEDYYWGSIKGAPFLAPTVCYNLEQNGHDDWYLPSKEELQLLMDNRNEIKHFDNYYYWSSSYANALSRGRAYAYSLVSASGGFEGGYLQETKRIRCIRDDSNDLDLVNVLPAPKSVVDCSDGIDDDIGSPCSDDTTYVGVFQGHKYYMPTGCKSNVHQAYDYSWNNGSDNWVTTGVNSYIDGEANTNTLVTLTDVGNPYLAAKFCYDMLYGGYDDWFLPAVSELQMIMDKHEDIGWLRAGSFDRNYSYWTSTEYDSDEAYFIYTHSQALRDYKKNKESYTEEPNVLCVRKVAI